MDISPTILANSQQINADDLTAAPRTVTITKVESGTAEQPVFIHLAEFPDRTYRPGKSMRRVLVAAWGAEASVYVGRTMTLFNDQSVRFGKDVTGGIRISALSHIDAPLTVALTVTRGQRKPYTVQPIKDTTDPKKLTDALADINGAKSLEALRTAWDLAATRGVQKHPDVITATNKRKAELESA